MRVAVVGMGMLFGLGVGCRSHAGDQAFGVKTSGVWPAEKIYRLRGRVVATDQAAGMATVNHQAVVGLMGPMTMAYKVADPSVLEELHPGDEVTARVLLAGEGPRLDDIVVVGQGSADYKPAVYYHVPTAGEEVPDFHLLNQSGRQIRLRQFRGKAVLLTFIYTRCPLAEFCPKMSTNFAAIDKALAADKKVYGRTHLMSVSFDPTYDTPAVLRSYGGVHTGRFADEDFAHWDFAAPSLVELPKLEQWFDVGVTGATVDPSSIQHSLSTVLIGRDGRVVAWFPTNDWKPGEVLEQMKAAAGE